MKYALLILSLAMATLQDPGASIEGVVVDGVTNKPIAGANVTVRLSRGAAMSGDDGRFVLTGLPPGPQQIRVVRDGYAPAKPEGRRATGNWQLVYTLAPQQQLKDVTIRLMPAGSVTGTVLDTRGDPVQGVTVIVSRPYFFQRESRFGPAPEGPIPAFGMAETNDRGDFRVFGLDAGEYYVLVDAGWGVSRRNNQGAELHRSLFYPGVPELERAQAVSVRPGEDVRLGTLTTPVVKTVPVHIRIVNQTGEALPAAFDTRGIYVDNEGGVYTTARSWGGPAAIEIPGLAEGVHSIAVEWQNERGVFFGQQRVVVGSEEVSADLLVRKGGRVSGRVVLESPDGTRTAVPGVRVNFAGKIPGGSSTNGRSATTSADGVFNVPSLPELEYQVSYAQLPANAYVSSVRLGNQDILGRNAVIAADTEIEVVLGSDGATVNGVVKDSQGRPAAGAFVVLAPEDARERSQLYRTVTTDQAGRFAAQGIRPADYRVFAWINLEGAAYLDNQYMKPFEDRVKPVRLVRGQTISLEIPLADEEGAQ